MEKFIRSVAQFIDNRKIKNLYGTHLDMNVRYFNIVLSLLILFPLISSIFIVSVSSSILLPLILIVTSVFYLIIGILANKTKKYYIYMCIVLYMFNFVMLPLIFLFGGGIEYGVWLYFMMGLFLSTFFIRHKLLIITLVLQSAFYSYLLYVEYTHPEVLKFVYHYFKFNIFTIPEQYILMVNFFIVAFCVGIIIKSMFVSYIDVHKTEMSLVSKLEQQTIRDPLTGCFNRRHLYCYLENLIKQAERENMSFSIIMYDIDKFKRLNDTYGHLMGDEVLCGVSNILMADLREYDIVARYGGEEFVIILPGAKQDAAEKRANQIRENIEHHIFAEEITSPVTISGGVAEFKRGMSAAKIIEIADTNLYDAKENGRNRIVCADCSCMTFDDTKDEKNKKDTKKKEFKNTKVIMCD